MRKSSSDEMVIGLTAFRSKCLELINDVCRGKVKRVVLTKHNEPVAALVPIDRAPVELWGAMKGSVRIAPGFDLAKGTGEAWQADG